LAAKHQTYDALTVLSRFGHSSLKPFVRTRIRFKIFPDSLHGYVRRNQLQNVFGNQIVVHN
jgi:hypothetical protein